jgi:hypothetical protein
MSKLASAALSSPPRSTPRVHTISGIVLNYEGQSDLTFVRSPDVSASGMFVNTARQFPEGAVVNVRFRLALTGASVSARGEVRYCLPGVGIGVEFIALDSATRKLIEREVACGAAGRNFGKKTEQPGRERARGPRSKRRRSGRR